MYNLLRNCHSLLALLCLLFVLVACGGQQQTMHTGSGNSRPIVPGKSTPTPPANATPTVQGMPPTMSPTTVPTSGVMVTTSRTTYLTSDTITVSISNNLSNPIYASPYYTNCTPVRLQMESGGTWVALGSCPEATQSVLGIESGSLKVFSLYPSTGLTMPHVHAGAAWTPGTYRISFNYTRQPDADGAGSGGDSVLSQVFAVS